ncbi:hypothetical protein SAVERM_3996 [Streptomyces avermitilis MA-4680 = NBRC 14893]|uniref:Uncharacterized protein n=1 Tax=Streptomyces avermitilis (strain ATCC 31267 / DSM 46492 / JCM 5070 / NBRC 14893 / NCIMB 12804 / NRRL 8165 / MA-4680) TaxID=227882 RepID=Q82GA2_STRAW|nr:hypothetical protein SAVERM_3996 [Streptomyces avermitilis MA-4680 = NBRC 14893]
MFVTAPRALLGRRVLAPWRVPCCCERWRTQEGKGAPALGRTRSYRRTRGKLPRSSLTISMARRALPSSEVNAAKRAQMATTVVISNGERANRHRKDTGRQLHDEWICPAAYGSPVRSGFVVLGMSGFSVPGLCEVRLRLGPDLVPRASSRSLRDPLKRGA